MTETTKTASKWLVRSHRNWTPDNMSFSEVGLIIIITTSEGHDRPTDRLEHTPTWLLLVYWRPCSPKGCWHYANKWVRSGVAVRPFNLVIWGWVEWKLLASCLQPVMAWVKCKYILMTTLDLVQLLRRNSQRNLHWVWKVKYKEMVDDSTSV